MSNETSAKRRDSFLGIPRTAIICGIVLLLCAVAVPYGMELLMKSRCRAYWRSQLELMAQGSRNYLSSRGTFPPAAILDEDGRSMHSWRVLLLPYLPQNVFYDQYELNEPWNGPNNQRLLQEYVGEPKFEDEEAYDITHVRWFYQCDPCAPWPLDGFGTSIVMVVDPNQPPVRVTERFPSSKIDNRWQAQVYAGEDLMFVGIEESDIHWMEPRDLSLREVHIQCDEAGKPTSSRPRITASVVMDANGEFQFFDEEETLERLQQMQLQSKVEPNSDQEKGAGPIGN
jgi:hypothetical protein